MVQRKAPDKLSIKADSKTSVNKSEKKCSPVLKPSSSQHQDIRNKGGTELKKLMKKSRSFKLSEFESLRSSPLRRVNLSVAATTPQKPPLNKIPETSPNYMKSTTSFDARRERLQVSPSSSQSIVCGSKRRNSNNSTSSSASGHKPVRILTKAKSLKPVRTLTKMSSMKAARPSMKRSSGVALYRNLNVGRATCSSTLKDSKFPDYVMLHQGGTESEGTSTMKVCPYTYCSLNGHCHAQLPPLKRFLSARRRLLKTQKSMRLKGLTPLRKKPSSERKKEIDMGQVEFKGDPAILEADSAGSAIAPLIDEAGMHFFVEIYAKPREEIDERSNNDGDDQAKFDFVEILDDISSSGGNDAETELENDGGDVSTGMPDESSYSEISFEDNLDENSDVLVAEVDISTTSPEDIQQVEVEDTDSPSLIQAETDLQCFCIGSESDGIHAENELDELVSEVSDMDWEEGEVVAPLVDNEACLPGFKDSELQDELVFKADDIVSDCCEEVLATGEVLQEVYEENTGSFIAEFGDDDSELDDGDQISENNVSGNIRGEESFVFISLSKDQFSSTEDAYEEQTAINEEKDGDPEPDDFNDNMVSSASAEDPLEELAAAGEEKNKVSEPNNPKVLTLLIDGSEEKEQIKDVNGLLGIQISDSCQDSKETDQDFRKEDHDAGPQTDTKIEVCQYDIIQEDDEVVDDDLPSLTQSHSSDDESDVYNMVENQEVPENDQSEEGRDLSNSSSTHPEEHSDPKRNKFSSAEGNIGREENIPVEDMVRTDAAETCLIANNVTGAEEEKTIIIARSDSDKQLPMTCSNLKKPIRYKGPIKDEEEPRKFNPREPRYLPVEPDLEEEKVDLRQQMMDERKNAEEWMLDYALQQAVTKLAPARKRRVSLLVEAFETIMPLPKYESHLQHATTSFAHARPIQACS